MHNKLSAFGIFVIFALSLILIFSFAICGVARAGEKEDLQKDITIIQLTIERNLYWNEYLKNQGQQIQMKIQAIEKSESEKAKDAKKPPSNK